MAIADCVRCSRCFCNQLISTCFVQQWDSCAIDVCCYYCFCDQLISTCSIQLGAVPLIVLDQH
jgi:hypothetical protein